MYDDAAAMLRAALASFHPANQPWITRHSYRHELIAGLTMSVPISLMTGSVVGVLAVKAFGASPEAFATIMAAEFFANLTSFLWAWLARGRRKVGFINRLQLLTLATIGAIALLPTHGAGAWVLTLLVVLTRCLLSGIVTVRSTVWRHNYPRSMRATVTGRLANLNSLIVAVVPLVGYALLDRNPEAFRLVYPASVLIGLIGVRSFSRVRLRGERELLRYERRPTARPQAKGEAGSIYEFDRDANPTFWQVLTQDRFFRSYMFWQFVSGSANMASETVVVFLLATITTGLGVGGVSLEYAVAILLSTAVPMAVATVTMSAWARVLDRMHIAAFRTRHAWVWVIDQVLNWIGAMVWYATESAPLALGVFAVARLAQGAARGGGLLAWNLGHNDFADRRLVALYMGIHVTLTGIRGAIVPFAALYLFAGDAALPAWLRQIAPSFDGIAPHVFLVAAACALCSEFGFRRLSRAVTARAAPAPGKPAAAPTD